MADEYEAALVKAFEEFRELMRKKDYLESLIVGKKQFIRAAIRQLPIEAQSGFEVQLDNLTRDFGSLTDAVKEALRLARVAGVGQQGFVTATKVRDLVLDSGFSFSGYKSNPSSSVHT